MKRVSYHKIISDLAHKMVFLVGPRQAGKTWLSKQIASEYQNHMYLNYDVSEHREIIRNKQWIDGVDLIIFDEIHKMKGWKNYLKGVYDTKSESMHILVTGSARMDIYRSAGDSMAGRFFVHHIMPFSWAELSAVDTDETISFQRLFERGGFPEPLLVEESDFSARWRALYTDTLLRQDVLEIQEVEKVSAIRHVYELLKSKVGSTISYQSIAQDVGISAPTVKRYITILEALYVVFVIRPYTNKVSRSILKEPKIYFFDYSALDDIGAKFENMIALSLYRHSLWKQDVKGLSYRIGFVRTKEGKEVDFVIIDEKNNPELLVEVKTSDTSLSKNLQYFSNKYNIPAVQLVKNITTEYQPFLNISVRSAEKYLRGLEV
jgi:predicted AAA+ superfamily ATPase